MKSCSTTDYGRCCQYCINLGNLYVVGVQEAAISVQESMQFERKPWTTYLVSVNQVFFDLHEALLICRI